MAESRRLRRAPRRAARPRCHRRPRFRLPGAGAARSPGRPRARGASAGGPRGRRQSLRRRGRARLHARSSSRSTAPASFPARSRSTSRSCRPTASPRGAIFLIAGGPGQGSAHVFGLGDDRRPSRSTASSSPATRSSPTTTAAPASPACSTARRCRPRSPPTPSSTRRGGVRGDRSAPPRDFYSTAEHAEDLEAVRQSLGVDKIALFGVSYGTKLALAYALAHPDHVERLLLDSVLPPELPDPYEANVLRAMPAHAGGVLLGRRLPRRDARLRRRRRRGREQARREAAAGQGARRRTAARPSKRDRRHRAALDRPRRRPEPRPRGRAAGGRSTPRGSATRSRCCASRVLHDLRQPSRRST